MTSIEDSLMEIDLRDETWTNCRNRPLDDNQEAVVGQEL